MQTYHRALAERNALLRTGQMKAELGAFEAAMAPAAADLVTRRTEGVKALSEVVGESYARVAGGEEPAGLGYRSDLRGQADPDTIAARLREGRERDLRFRSTTTGPHRDDFDFLIDGRPARDFGSEGQQRLLVVALRLGQALWFRRCTGIEPILLADDVVGELDAERRARFWSALPSAAQVIATGTEPPEGADGNWEYFQVKSGAFSRRA